MIKKERSSIIPAVVSMWCTQFQAPCDSCQCVLRCRNEKKGWCTVKSKAEQRCSHRCPNSNSSSNSFLFTFPPTKPTMLMSDLNIAITQYHYGHIIISVSFIRGRGCPATEWRPLVCVSPSVSVASCTQSSRQSKQCPCAVWFKGMLHVR